MKNPVKQETKKRSKIKVRTACPLCGCKELLTEGMDQFCLSCDWDTCAEYVEKGWMDHLEFACKSQFPSSAKAEESVALLTERKNEKIKKPA